MTDAQTAPSAEDGAAEIETLRTQLLEKQEELDLLKSSNEAALERVVSLESQLLEKDQEIATYKEAVPIDDLRAHVLQQQSDLADLIASNEARKIALDDAVKEFAKTIKSV